MKSILTLLIVTVTFSMANSESSPLKTSSKKIDSIKKKPELITREIRTFRTVRKNREVRKTRKPEIKTIASLPLTRVNRKIRNNRNVRYVQIQVPESLRLASLK